MFTFNYGGAPEKEIMWQQKWQWVSHGNFRGFSVISKVIILHIFK